MGRLKTGCLNKNRLCPFHEQLIRRLLESPKDPEKPVEQQANKGRSLGAPSPRHALISGAANHKRLFDSAVARFRSSLPLLGQREATDGNSATGDTCSDQDPMAS